MARNPKANKKNERRPGNVHRICHLCDLIDGQRHVPRETCMEIMEVNISSSYHPGGTRVLGIYIFGGVTMGINL